MFYCFILQEKALFYFDTNASSKQHLSMKSGGVTVKLYCYFISEWGKVFSSCIFYFSLFQTSQIKF